MRRQHAILNVQRGAPRAAVNARYSWLTVGELLKMTDTEIRTVMAEFAAYYVPPVRVDVSAFHAGVTTWLDALRRGAYAYDEFAAFDIVRHLDLWYVDLDKELAERRMRDETDD